MQLQSFQAIVLRTTPYREADIIGTLVSDSAGLVNFIARHAKRSSKRLGGGIEALDCATFECAEPKKSDGLFEVLSVSNRIIWHGLHHSPAIFCSACLLAELGTLFCKTHEDSKAFYHLLKENIDHLNTSHSRDEIREVLISGVVAILRIAGLNPAHNALLAQKVNNRSELSKAESVTLARELLNYIESYTGHPLRTRESLNSFLLR